MYQQLKLTFTNYYYIYSFILKYYTYFSRPILIHVTFTYLFVIVCQFSLSFFMSQPSLLAALSFFPYCLLN